jgi:hypothetical protein
MKQRSTMTNFAKKAIFEQNMVTSIPIDGNPSRGGTVNSANTFDDDYEPVRPSMNTMQQAGNAEGYPPPNPPAYEHYNESNESYDDNGAAHLPQSRQSNSIGVVNRSTRMMAQ